MSHFIILYHIYIYRYIYIYMYNHGSCKYYIFLKMQLIVGSILLFYLPYLLFFLYFPFIYLFAKFLILLLYTTYMYTCIYKFKMYGILIHWFNISYNNDFFFFNFGSSIPPPQSACSYLFLTFMISLLISL